MSSIARWSDHPYTDYLVDQASTAYDHNRTENNEYGLHWAGPIEHINGATQQSAVDLLVAAQPIEDASPDAGQLVMTRSRKGMRTPVRSSYSGLCRSAQ